MFEQKYSLPVGFDKKCEVFCNLILKYNKVHNITGAKTASQVMQNIEDSLFPITFLPLETIKNAIEQGLDFQV